MDTGVLILVQVLYAVASLFLIAVGLAIVFGMMGVINFAHGEFLMIGGFAFVLAVHAGVNFWVAMFLVAPLTVALIGVIVERLIIRHLYGRIVDTVLATWGLSLLFIGIASETLGYFQEGVAPPFGSVSIGAYRTGMYTFFVIGVAVAVLVVLYALLRYTPFGLIARGTMQNASMAAALGTNVRAVYSVTFGIGAAVSGLAGAVLAPIAGVLPVIGATYIAEAFITVIVGGASPLAGTALAATLLGTINEATTFVSTAVLGEVALLFAAIVLLRFLPAGITGRFLRGSV